MKKILLLFILGFGLFYSTTVFAEEVAEVTESCQLYGELSEDSVVKYSCYVKEYIEENIFEIDGTTYNLPSGLLNYNSKVAFRITYNPSTKAISKLELYNLETDEVITDTSQENIDRLFNIEYGKTIQDKTWVETLNLSNLSEGTIYKYTATSTVQFPTLNNDLGKNVLVYLKERDDEVYDEEIYTTKTIKSSALSASFNEYTSGESFNIMYEIVDNEEFLSIVDSSDVIMLSSYSDGDTLSYQFEKYIYNDTNKNIILKTKDSLVGSVIENEVTIPKNTIYGFDWMIDTVVIDIQSSSSQINNGTGGGSKENNPDTGLSISVVGLICMLIGASLLLVLSTKHKRINRI